MLIFTISIILCVFSSWNLFIFQNLLQDHLLQGIDQLPPLESTTCADMYPRINICMK